MSEPTVMKRGALFLLVVLIASVGSTVALCAEEGDGEPSLSTPAEAYDALKAVIDAQDLEGYKSLMSSKLAKRLEGAEYYIAQGVLDGKEFFEKVPKSEPVINGDEASIAKTYDEGNVLATYSFEFLLEDGRWMFNGYKTSTKSK